MSSKTLIYLKDERMLAIRYQDYDSNKPIKRTWYYPIMHMAQSEAERYHPLNQEAYGEQGGIYKVYWPDSSIPIRYQLIDGGKTLPIEGCMEEQTVPAPKTNKETRWNGVYGRWEKYLKTQGWVRA